MLRLVQTLHQVLDFWVKIKFKFVSAKTIKQAIKNKSWRRKKYIPFQGNQVWQMMKRLNLSIMVTTFEHSCINAQFNSIQMFLDNQRLLWAKGQTAIEMSKKSIWTSLLEPRITWCRLSYRLIIFRMKYFLIGTLVNLQSIHR